MTDPVSFPVPHPTVGDVALMWADPAEVEAQARDQIANIAALPWVHGARVMPDVHYGKGATVGSVIAMRDAVSPAAVGVDIGCVDADTEFLTPTGWKRIADYTDGDQVMQYDPNTNIGRFVTPERYIAKPADGPLLHFRTKYGIDMMLSADHRVLIWRTVGRDRRLERQVISAGALAAEHCRLVLGARVNVKTSFEVNYLGDGMRLSDAQLRVQVMLMADGYLDKAGRCSLHLSKRRKIERAEKLLADAGIDYTCSTYEADGTTRVSFVPPIAVKTYDERFWAMAPSQLRIVCDEVLCWDGNIDDRCFYTRDRASADFIQYAFTATGHRAVLRGDANARDGKIDYRVHVHDRDLIGLCASPKTPVVEVEATDGMQYCFTVPSSFWVMRRNGKVAITGNCGMSSVRTSLTVEQLPDDLGALRSAIEAAIPVGFNQHDEPAAQAHQSYLMSLFPTLHEDVQDRRDKAARQVGTLGGGNHFIEVQADDDGQVWLMLHSGSRNIGKELAERHIKVAKAQAHNAGLPDSDLAVFLADTPEMAAYRHDLDWAQDYARTNRAVMMMLLVRAVEDWAASHNLPDIVFGSPISCHHNYVSEETYDDVPLLVTRKGAISAKAGELGIIPGSMGTGSYIVRGLGNTASFCSASHGAGRRMSRSKAKKTFTVDDLAAQTAGVECRKDKGVLDEIPGAYKDVDSVIAAQADLVEVVAHTRALLCVKG